MSHQLADHELAANTQLHWCRNKAGLNNASHHGNVSPIGVARNTIWFRIQIQSRARARPVATRPRAITQEMVLLQRLWRSRFVRVGFPMIAFVVIGSFGLAEFTSIRVTKRDEKNRMLTADETLKFMKKKERVDVDEEYKELMEKLDIDQWENKRGPRPWEEGTMDR